MEQEDIIKIFDEIACNYDKMNNLISFGMHNSIKKSSAKLLALKPFDRGADLCCGSGDFVEIVSKIYPEAKIIGIDKSSKMIEQAKLKHPEKTFLEGDCLKLEYGDETFDFITMGFGLRNVLKRKEALFEIRRVLKKGGKFLHLDFGKRNVLNKIFDFCAPKFALALNLNKENYEYLTKSKNSYPEPKELMEEFIKAGFSFKKRKDFLFGAICAQIFLKK